jgi:hypothetical protein
MSSGLMTQKERRYMRRRVERKRCHARAILLENLAVILPVVLLAAQVSADTLYLKDGSTIEGTVTRNDAETVVIEIGNGQTTLSAADVARIERNDKKGQTMTLTILRAKQHQDGLDQRTGLTAEQRDAVRAAVEPLWSPDEAERAKARKKLLAMSKEMAVFKYLESYLPYTKGLVTPEIMRTLVDMDPAKAKDTVLTFTQNSDPANRAKALELIASYKSGEDLETLARGLVDVDNTVRIAAAHAVAALSAKSATPALLEALKSADPKVQNASRDALRQLWSTSSATVNLSTPEEWNAFWKSKAREVKDPISPSALTPLISAEELAEATSSHDE